MTAANDAAPRVAVKDCAHCGKPLPGKMRKQALFCSTACRVMNWKAGQMAMAKAVRNAAKGEGMR